MTSNAPWGFAYPEVPSTHLFLYPDLGISILNGLIAEQKDAPGIRVAVLVDPGEVQATEIDIAISSFRSRAVFISGIGGLGATVHRVKRTIEYFPYDLLLISTHCGDAPGWRWTYEFVDSEGINRHLVIDTAIDIAVVPGDEKLSVTQYMTFVALDGVDWKDPAKKDKLYFGTAMRDFMDRTSQNRLEPVKKEPIGRVPGSAALKMADYHFIPVPSSLADNGSPIIINNACASWHRLAKTFTFGNARAYIGTLFSVTNIEAHEIVKRLLERHFGKSLAVALWHAQNEVYGNGDVRRPYILVGVHSQRLRTTEANVPVIIYNRLRLSLRTWTKTLEETDKNDDSKVRSATDIVRFLQSEADRFRQRLGLPTDGPGGR